MIDPVTKFAEMSDEQLSKVDVIWDGEGDALKAERTKRQRIKYEEQALVKQRKEAVEYSDALAQEICERIAIGELLINICDDEHLPTLRHTNQWLREHTDFSVLYQSALNDRLSIFEEQVIQIADDMQHDFKTVIKNGREKRVNDPDMVARARLRIEVRFKHLKAGRPAKWGDVSTLNVKNQDEFDTSNLSADELEAQIADIEKKSNISRRAA